MYMKTLKTLKTLIITVLILLSVTLPASADMGPKPDLVIDFSGIHEPCVVTVLSTVKSYGPNQPMQIAWMPWWDEQAPAIDKEIYQKFIDETARLNQDRTEQLYFWGVLEEKSPYVFGYILPKHFMYLYIFRKQTPFCFLKSLIPEQSFTQNCQLP